jgi:hypothetical protein
METHNITALLDQLSAAIGDQARPVLAYYEALTGANLPEELVCELVLQFADMWWRKCLGLPQEKPWIDN